MLVAETPVGKTIDVEVLRNGKAKTLEVTIAKLKENEIANTDTEDAIQKGKGGLALRDLRPEEREQRGRKDDEGVLVGGVRPDSPAAEAGIRVGDVILQVNKSNVASAADVKAEIGKAKSDSPLLLLLRRADGGNLYASLAAK